MSNTPKGVFSVHKTEKTGRIDIRFAEIPPIETRTLLKKTGFKWHNKDAKWFCYNSPITLQVAKLVAVEDTTEQATEPETETELVCKTVPVQEPVCETEPEPTPEPTPVQEVQPEPTEPSKPKPEPKRTSKPKAKATTEQDLTPLNPNGFWAERKVLLEALRVHTSNINAKWPEYNMNVRFSMIENDLMLESFNNKGSDNFLISFQTVVTNATDLVFYLGKSQAKDVISLLNTSKEQWVWIELETQTNKKVKLLGAAITASEDWQLGIGGVSIPTLFKELQSEWPDHIVRFPVRSVKMMLDFVSKDELKPAMNHLAVFWNTQNYESNYEMAACNAHILCVQGWGEVSSTLEDNCLLIPPNVANLIVKYSNPDEYVDARVALSYSYGKNKIALLSWSDTKRGLVFYSMFEKPSQRFPDYRSLEHYKSVTATFNPNQLISILKRGLPFAKKSTHLFKFTITSNEIHLLAEDLDYESRFEDKLPAKAEFNEEGAEQSLVIGFNGEFLLSVLNNLTDMEDCTFEFGTPTQSVTVKHHCGYSLIMPVMLSNY